jgi:hypothetical protein
MTLSNMLANFKLLLQHAGVPGPCKGAHFFRYAAQPRLGADGTSPSSRDETLGNQSLGFVSAIPVPLLKPSVGRAIRRYERSCTSIGRRGEHDATS